MLPECLRSFLQCVTDEVFAKEDAVTQDPVEADQGPYGHHENEHKQEEQKRTLIARTPGATTASVRPPERPLWPGVLHICQSCSPWLSVFEPILVLLAIGHRGAF